MTPASDNTRLDTALDRPVVVVYRDVLLNYNEPFIFAQGEWLRRYRSHYVGVRRVAGLEPPRERTLILRECYHGVDRVLDPVVTRLPSRALRVGGVAGRAAEAAFKWLGMSPPSVVRTLRALRPALLHAHTGIDGAVALPLAQRLHVPLVVTFTGFDATATDAELRRNSLRCHAFLRRREALKRAARLIIAVSEFIRGQLLERGWPGDKVVVHHIGVDTELFRPEPAVTREPVVLAVGRLLETKGVTHLITAIHELQARLPEAQLVIAGEGPLRRQLEDQARESGVRVRFLGAIPSEEVRGWMSRARALCVPSVTASNGTVEALPMVALEAQAMGLPVVGFASGGIPEAVVHGTTGLLAPERDVGALATHLITVLTDAALWTRLSAAGVQRVRERFDLRRQTARLEDLYDAARGVATRSDHDE